MISDYICDSTPVIISVVFPNEDGEKGAHALLAIGIETNTDGATTKILCLDPGYSSPKYAQWNCFIDISQENNSDYPFNCVSENGHYKVSLDEMLIIEKE